MRIFVNLFVRSVIRTTRFPLHLDGFVLIHTKIWRPSAYMETHPNSIVQLEENARGGRLTTPLGNSKVPILTAVKSFVLDSSCHFSAGSTSDVHLRCTQTSTPHSPQWDVRHVTHASATSPALHVTWHWALFTPLTSDTQWAVAKSERGARERERVREGGEREALSSGFIQGECPPRTQQRSDSSSEKPSSPCNKFAAMPRVRSFCWVFVRGFFPRWVLLWELAVWA